MCPFWAAAIKGAAKAAREKGDKRTAADKAARAQMARAAAAAAVVACAVVAALRCPLPQRCNWWAIAAVPAAPRWWNHAGGYPFEGPPSTSAGWRWEPLVVVRAVRPV